MSLLVKKDSTTAEILPIYLLAGTPALDLQFAFTKSLTDYISGTDLITFTRASSGTFVDSTGTLQTAATDAPRFDHNPATGESLGLLVEEQRTNSLTYSEDTSQWLTPTNITLSQNQTTAPDGTSTADQYLETAATGLHVQDGMPFTFVTSTVYTYSVFVKSIGGRNFEIGYPPTIFTNRFARFNLSGSGSVQGSDAGVTASIQAYANGWYRCSATNTCALGASSRISNFIINDSFSRSYAGDVTKGLFIWGAQLEAGAFPTSYIPTTTAAATRSADVASITGANFSSWYRQDEGTVFCSWQFPTATNTPGARVFDIVNTASPDTLARARVSGGTTNVYDVLVANVTQATFAGSILTANLQYRLGFALKANDFAASENGSLSVDASGTVPAVDRIGIGSTISGSSPLNGTIRRLTYWPVRLGNTVLQQITQ
jgi:hypothetical protein